MKLIGVSLKRQPDFSLCWKDCPMPYERCCAPAKTRARMAHVIFPCINHKNLRRQRARVIGSRRVRFFAYRTSPKGDF